ncbi:hypothetical protein [Azospirillum argentinense]
MGPDHGPSILRPDRSSVAFGMRNRRVQAPDAVRRRVGVNGGGWRSARRWRRQWRARALTCGRAERHRSGDGRRHHGSPVRLSASRPAVANLRKGQPRIGRVPKIGRGRRLWLSISCFLGAGPDRASRRSPIMR